MQSVDDDFDAFVRDRGAALIRAGYLLTGDQQLAEDLVQTALSRTYRSWRRLDDPANAEAYTRKVMYHLQISWWRRRRVPESLGAAPPESAVGDGVNRLAVRLALRSALARLTAKQRAVLLLRFFEDRTEAETARLLSVSVGTVKVQTSRALARMRALAPELADLDATDLDATDRVTADRDPADRDTADRATTEGTQ